MAHALTASHEAPRLIRLLQTVKERFIRHRLFRQTVDELSGLSNRQLADLGMNRSMIRRVAYQAAYDMR
ncbi:DUF1127 domain-containing protein [Sedimentitalea nanhaiensis]|uniref:YjiS-like domain-containing protein n=1 Tax=Sedimentitalea nanhaiensis TaxID=999627 RepID=A0A1I7B412_9RHOB|nr:DUF1127 domain-containing protein [Sedimentitalea nanhaiensis]SFT81960.1 protein of unknown function [Sedimentitalea nanhaiensis]